MVVRPVLDPLDALSLNNQLYMKKCFAYRALDLTAIQSACYLFVYDDSSVTVDKLKRKENNNKTVYN